MLFEKKRVSLISGHWWEKGHMGGKVVECNKCWHSVSEKNYKGGWMVCIKRTAETTKASEAGLPFSLPWPSFLLDRHPIHPL